jgi:DNA (cytosine-5)-methyltransferase 1
VDTPTWNVLALCAGGAGLERGLRLAVENARVVCSVEIESFACEVLASHGEAGDLDDAPIWTDIKTFDGKPWRGVVDCIAGGYPCQPFSQAGKRKGEADPRHLWPDVARIVREVEPEWCFFENVAGHVSLGLRGVKSELEAMGYRVEAGLFTAAEVGASHKRERIFILAHRSSERRQQNTISSPCHEKENGGAGWNKLKQDSDNKPSGEGSGLANPERMQRDDAEASRSDGEGESSGRASESVADAKGDVWRAESVSGSRDKRAARTSSPEVELPRFPPGPGDREAWARILAIRPDLAPALSREEEAELALRGMAHGLAGGISRADALRLLGNGVVPAQAAAAFSELYGKIIRTP